MPFSVLVAVFGMASTPIVPDVKTTQDPLDALLSELLASSGGEEAGRGRGRHNDSGAEVRKTPSTAVGSRQAGRHVEDHDPWKALSDQVCRRPLYHTF